MGDTFLRQPATLAENANGYDIRYLAQKLDKIEQSLQKLIEASNLKNTPNQGASTKKVKKAKNTPSTLFLDAYKLYPGNKSRQSDWEKFIKHKDYKDVEKLLVPAIELERIYKINLRKKGEFCPSWKNFSTWINQRCWEQEFPVEQSAPIVGAERVPVDL